MGKNLESGENLSGDCDPIQVYSVKVENGYVYIDVSVLIQQRSVA